MIKELSQAIVSLSEASGIAKKLTETSDPAKINATILELQQTIITAQQQVLFGQAESTRLVARIAELEADCLRLRLWTGETQRYKRKEVGTGVYVYVDSAATASDEDVTKLCSVCFEKSIKTPLQQQVVNPGRMINLICPNGCPTLIFTHYLSSVERSASGNRNGF